MPHGPRIVRLRQRLRRLALFCVAWPGVRLPAAHGHHTPWIMRPCLGQPEGRQHAPAKQSEVRKRARRSALPNKRAPVLPEAPSLHIHVLMPDCTAVGDMVMQQPPRRTAGTRATRRVAGTRINTLYVLAYRHTDRPLYCVQVLFCAALASC